MASKYIERKRILVKMENIERYPLSIVHAPMGYGKTVAVREYLKTTEADWVWVSLAGSEGEADYLWARLCDALNGVNEELAARFSAIGFPYDCFKTDALLDVLMDYDYKNHLILVFDDFHTIEENNVFELMKAIVRERLTGLHIVLITRELAKLDAADLYQKQLCFTITEKSLKFNREEVFRYLDFMECRMSEEERERVFQITDGWESMLYITAKGIKQGLPVGKSATADDIIEQNFYHGLSQAEKEVLWRLSVLSSFTKRMAAAVLDDSELYDAFETLISRSVFFVFHESGHTYRLRNILKDYVYERALIDRVDFTEVYRKSGRWLLADGQYSKAFECLYRAGELEEILSILNKDTQNDKGIWGSGNIRQVFEKAGKDLCYRYPFAYLKYLLACAMDGERNYIPRVKLCLDRLEEYCRGSEYEGEMRELILGEISMVRSRISFNDIAVMAEYAGKSAEFFGGGCSCIVTRETEFTYGLPCMLMGFVKEPGSMAEVRDAFAAEGMSFAEATDGCGIGCDSLAASEAALETGAWEQAELHAYKAYFKAKAAEQLSIMISSKLVLDRLNLIQGSSRDRILSNSTLKDEVIAANNPVLNTTFDLCGAYLNGCLGRLDSIPEWIRKGEIGKGKFFFQGTGFFYMVYGKCLLLGKKYIELDSLCESFATFLKPFQYHLVRIYFLIYESVAKSYLESRPRGEEILKEALALAEKDHLIMPFAENTGHVRLMLEALLKREESPYIREVLEACRRYSSQLKLFHACEVSLTDRELEILKLLDEGYTHEEIAGEIYISIATVRYHVKNIYQKLDVNNKILALRKAKDLNLI